MKQTTPSGFMSNFKFKICKRCYLVRDCLNEFNECGKCEKCKRCHDFEKDYLNEFDECEKCEKL